METKVAYPDPESILNSSSCRTRILIQNTDPEVLKMPSILQKSTRNTSKIIFLTFYDFFSQEMNTTGTGTSPAVKIQKSKDSFFRKCGVMNPQIQIQNFLEILDPDL